MNTKRLEGQPPWVIAFWTHTWDIRTADLPSPLALIPEAPGERRGIRTFVLTEDDLRRWPELRKEFCARPGDMEPGCRLTLLNSANGALQASLTPWTFGCR